MFLEVESLSFAYRDGENRLNDISFSAARGEVLTLIGANGAGKSTLLKVLARQLVPQNGRVFLEGVDIHREFSAADFATHAAYMPQRRFLPAELDVLETVMLGYFPQRKKICRKESADRAMQLLSQLGCGYLACRRNGTLSGGEQQLVSLALALAQDPELILIDEATEGLDIRHRIEFIEVINRISREKNCTVIQSMHDLSLLGRISGRVAALKNSALFACGKYGDEIDGAVLSETYGLESSFFENVLLFSSAAECR
jgi:iron complex transport system ATP-binding protein